MTLDTVSRKTNGKGSRWVHIPKVIQSNWITIADIRATGAPVQSAMVLHSRLRVGELRLLPFVGVGCLRAQRRPPPANGCVLDRPPSTAIAWPLTYDASSLARNNAAPAISAGMPARRSGFNWPILSWVP